MNLSQIEFDELEFEEIGTWPLILRIGVVILTCIATLAGSGYLLLKPKVAEIDSLNVNIEKLKRDFKTKYNQAANLEAYEKQMKEMRRTYRLLLRQLPSSGQVASLIDDISQQATNSGLEYNLIKPGKATDLGFYVELPIDLEIQGTYHGFGEFVSGISKLPRIVTMHNFTITLNNNAEDDEAAQQQIPLDMKVEAKTYWTNPQDGKEEK